MAGLLVVRSRKVSAERQKGQVQVGSPNWGEEEQKRSLGYIRCLCLFHQTPPALGRGGVLRGGW